MADKNYGFKDLRTAAELALAPYLPKGRSVSSSASIRPQGGRFGKALGTIASAATMSSATFSQLKASIQAKQQLTVLAGSLQTAVTDFDRVTNALLSGTTTNRDVSVFGLASENLVQSERGFFTAQDLAQSSVLRAGSSLTTSATARAQLADRKKQLSKIYTRVSTQLGNFSLTGAIISENYNRSTNPLPDQIDLPSIPRLAQGDAAAAADSILKDKRRFVIRGVPAALAQPTFWMRFAGTKTDPLRAFKLMPGFNRKLNMTFKDEKSNQSGWSEPAPPYAAQFPYNKVQQTESGHVWELDDTPGAERVHIFHRAGSFIEFHPDGKVVMKSMNHGYLISMADQYVKVKGACNISVDGDASIYARGALNLQSDNDINVNTTKDFNVFAKNVNLRARKDARLDGMTVDLRYAKLPGKPVLTPSGIAVRLIPSAIKRDFPDIAETIEKANKDYNASLTKIQSGIIRKMGTDLAAKAAIGGAFGVATTVGTTAPMASTILAGTRDMLRLTSLLQRGPYASEEAVPSFTYPTLSATQEPKENPLGNPLVYQAETNAAVAYRGLMFDTPEELQDAEMYQAHLDTRKALKDIPTTVGPELAGSRRLYTTGLADTVGVRVPNLLNREDYRGQYQFTPQTVLANTTFTVRDLVDSLAYPDVANYIPSPDELAELQQLYQQLGISSDRFNFGSIGTVSANTSSAATNQTRETDQFGNAGSPIVTPVE